MAPIRVRLGGQPHDLQRGQRIELPDDKAQLLLERAPGKVRVVSSTIQPGSRVIWVRGNGSAQEGLVDFVHVDEMGTRWVFVTVAEGWAAVNLKFVKGITL